jgi:hypothetical protein
MGKQALQMIDWLFVLWFAVGMFAAGYCLAYMLAVLPNIWAAKDKSSTALPTRENDADAVVMALNVVEQPHEKFYLAFEAMSHEDRVRSKGPQVAHMCDRLWNAYEQIEDAWQVARGDKIVCRWRTRKRALVPWS